MATKSGQTTTEVRTGAPKVGGYAFAAPLATTRPTDAVAPLAAGYIDLGYISEDGIEVTTDKGTQKIYDWNRDVIAVLEESNEATVKLTFKQLSAAVLKELFGAGNVSDSDGVVTSVKYTGQSLPHRQFAFPMQDANGAMLLEIGDGQITKMPGFKLKKNETIDLEVEMELFKSADGGFFNLLFG